MFVLLIPPSMIDDEPAWRAFHADQLSDGYEVAEQRETFHGAIQARLAAAPA